MEYESIGGIKGPSRLTCRSIRPAAGGLLVRWFRISYRIALALGVNSNVVKKGGEIIDTYGD
jgi:hypothetical protein